MISSNTPKHNASGVSGRYSSSKPIRTVASLNKSLIPELKLNLLSSNSPQRPKKKLNLLYKAFKVSSKRMISTQRSFHITSSYNQIKYDNPQKEFDSLEIPVSFDVILEKFSRYLHNDEKSEVIELKKIYFLALSIPKPIFNEGEAIKYDDDLGNYNLIQGDSIAYRFEVLEILGRGSFSQVCRCLDHKKSEIVALKIIKNKKKFIAQANIEIRLLENINNKDLDESSNVIHLKESFIFRGHTCLVFDLLSINLYELLKDNNFKGLSLHLIRKITTQILHCLRFLKSLHIIHCDLKPENILLRSPENSSVKLIDFGSGCYEHERIYTYVQSRFYRAPEVILGIPYTAAIDIWSLGCIVAELYTASPLFPAENEVELMSMIFEINDIPPIELLGRATKKKIFFDRENRPRLIIGSNGKVIRPKTKRLEDIIKCNDAKFLDFIQSKFLIRMHGMGSKKKTYSWRSLKTWLDYWSSTKKYKKTQNSERNVLIVNKKCMIYHQILFYMLKP